MIESWLGLALLSHIWLRYLKNTCKSLETTRLLRLNKVVEFLKISPACTVLIRLGKIFDWSIWKAKLDALNFSLKVIQLTWHRCHPITPPGCTTIKSNKLFWYTGLFHFVNVPLSKRFFFRQHARGPALDKYEVELRNKCAEDWKEWRSLLLHVVKYSPAICDRDVFRQ